MMSAHVCNSSTSHSLPNFTPTRPSDSFTPANNSIKHFSGFNGFKGKWLKLRFSVQCTAVLQSDTTDTYQSDQHTVTNLQEILDSHKNRENVKFSSPTEIMTCVRSIREIFRTMDDGETTVSPYDTAWVALVEDKNKPKNPQFPSSLKWIVDNQLSDGSWGDHKLFLAHDRILNTLACVIALRSWNVYPQKVERGWLFVTENIDKLADDKFEHMPIGFEVAFPSLVDIAETFNINVPKNLPIMQKIYAQRDLKLSRIPKDIMHQVPTTLLYSLEGLSELDWKKLLKLQSEDGSFLTSPSSTAYALMKTKDENCLNYLSKIVQRFNGGVPTAYPVDMFEHSWAVDRLERLGISRYFKSEIKECMDYIYRYWSEKGICWARNSRVTDIDDTSMAFRLLRLHGYTVSQDVYRNFESNGEFFAFAGQSNQAVTGMLNLLRAAQVLYPEENLLEDAKKFSFEYLKGKQAKGQLIDKWIIIKDLPGEVEYALDLPWYASLPRLEACFYLNQYGGEDDVWIGKTLYRMPHVNNNNFLQLAKLDYAKCQTIHQLEWNHMKDWYENSKLEKFGMSEEGLLLSYYLAASSLFEPELSNQRFAWAKTSTFVETISSYFESTDNLIDQRKAFVQDFINITDNIYYSDHGRYISVGNELTGRLVGMLKQLTLDTIVVHGVDIQHQLHRAVQNEDSYYVNTGGITTMEIESNMQELVRLVLCSSPDSLDPEFKQIFFMVARTFYYTAYCNPNTINGHINKVLFGSRM